MLYGDGPSPYVTLQNVGYVRRYMLMLCSLRGLTAYAQVA
jgi:hypothetical protein